ncbi:MAG: VWA domain-containing protein [Desulfamplus sp.]|nr:VWA domain-containing protein [Desulfamplus sp.]
MSKIETTPDGITGEASRRKLHFFWIVDDSGSMSGSKIQKVNWAIRDVLPEIEKIGDENRLEIMMSAIKFGNDASWHVGPDPVGINQFKWKDMSGNSGCTATSKALKLLIDSLDHNKLGKRNVPPVCILLSDGHCTDSEKDYMNAINTLNDSSKLPWGTKAVRLSIGIAEQEGDYNKEELDMFISPYLRTEQKIETLHADSPRKLVQFIKTASTAAVKASSDTPSNTNHSQSTPPVNLSKSNLNDAGVSNFQNVTAEDAWEF